MLSLFQDFAKHSGNMEGTVQKTSLLCRELFGFAWRKTGSRWIQQSFWSNIMAPWKWIVQTMHHTSMVHPWPIHDPSMVHPWYPWVIHGWHKLNPSPAMRLWQCPTRSYGNSVSTLLKQSRSWNHREIIQQLFEPGFVLPLPCWEPSQDMENYPLLRLSILILP